MTSIAPKHKNANDFRKNIKHFSKQYVLFAFMGLKKAIKKHHLYGASSTGKNGVGVRILSAAPYEHGCFSATRLPESAGFSIPCDTAVSLPYKDAADFLCPHFSGMSRDTFTEIPCAKAEKHLFRTLCSVTCYFHHSNTLLPTHLAFCSEVCRVVAPRYKTSCRRRCSGAFLVRNGNWCDTAPLF